MKKIVLLRHGESAWNKENRFTGWTDVDLTEKGIAEACKAGELLKENGFNFDKAYTSYLKRAVKTLNCVLDRMDQDWIPVEKSWRLNEKHYGDLQGLNKQETAEKYGEDQVLKWRRSYNTLPPLMDPDNPLSPVRDRRYANLQKRVIPMGENLETTLDRVIPFWEDQIAPAVLDRKTILVTAHGNSLRALIKYIEEIPDDEIMALEIPTGQPLVYELNDDLTIIRKYYL